MTKCGECKHSKDVSEKPDFVRCELRLPSWVAVRDDYLSGEKLVLKADHCSFGECREPTNRRLAELQTAGATRPFYPF